MSITEMQKVLRLVDPNQPTAIPANSTPTITAVQSGNWSDPATWGGSSPPEPSLTVAGSVITVNNVTPAQMQTIVSGISLPPTPPNPSATLGATPGPNDQVLVLSNMTPAQAQAIAAAVVLPPPPAAPSMAISGDVITFSNMTAAQVQTVANSIVLPPAPPTTGR